MSDAENKPDGAIADQPLVVHTQYVKDLSFENPNAPRIFTFLQQKVPQMEVAIDLSAAKLQERVYEVTLKLGAHPKAEDRSVFLVELEYSGLVSVKETVQPEQIDSLVFVEAPSIIFPFARRIIADLTRDGGFPPLLINPIDFAELYRQRQYEVTDAVPAASPDAAAEAEAEA